MTTVLLINLFVLFLCIFIPYILWQTTKDEAFIVIGIIAVIFDIFIGFLVVGLTVPASNTYYDATFTVQKGENCVLVETDLDFHLLEDARSYNMADSITDVSYVINNNMYGGEINKVLIVKDKNGDQIN